MTDKHLTVFAALAAALVMASLFAVPLMGGSSDAAAGDSQDEPFTQQAIQGQTWQYTPEFPASLSPTLSIAYQGTTWTSTNGTYASMQGDDTIRVAIPANAPAGNYYIVLKAVTTNPAQEAYQYIIFDIKPKLTLSGDGTVSTYVGQTGNKWTPVTNAADVGNVTFTSTTLPAGLTINESTGVISGSPTEAGSKQVIVTATAQDPKQTAQTTVTIDVEGAMSISGESAIAVPSDEEATLQLGCNIEGVSWSITDYGGLDGKVTVSDTGLVTVSGLSDEDAGEHTVTVKAVSSTGQSVTKQITVDIAVDLGFGVPEFTLVVEG